MIKFLKVIISLMFLASAANASCNAYDFKHFTTNQGLPHNYITSIYQDSEGFIWLATRSGVTRYDGYEFKSFSTLLPDRTRFPSFSQHILESSDGNIWVFGPKISSYYLDGSEFYQYSDDYVFGYPDHKGNLWLVNDTSLFRIRLDSADIIDDSPGAETDRLRLVCKERNNTRWVFREFDRQQLQNSAAGHERSYTFKIEEYESLIINSVYIDSENTIWISTFNSGLIRVDQGSGDHLEFKHFTTRDNGLSHNSVNNVYEIENDLLWIGTADGINILHRSSGTFDYIRHDQLATESLSDNVVTCFFKERSGTIFVGTRYGLNIGRNRKFEHHHKIEGRNSITHNNIHAFQEDDAGNLWILSSGGVDKLNRETNRYESFPVTLYGSHTLKAPPVSVCPDHEGNFWIGTWQGGLHYLHTRESRFDQYLHDYQKGNTISHNSIMSVFRDSRNQIWLGTWGGGINLYDPKSKHFTIFSYDPNDEKGLSNDEISCFAEDHTGRLWIGTLNGLNLLIDSQQKIFKRFFFDQNDSTTLSNNQITSLYISEKFLWIGTNYGLNRLNLQDLSMERFFSTNGLPSDHIKAIIDDESGNLWVSTNKGVANLIFNSMDNNQIERIVTFSTFDGLQDDEFLDRAVYRSSSGEIFFGGTNGYNRFDPEKISEDTILPETVITKLSVDGKEISIGEKLFGEVILKDPITKTRKITLSYKQKSFSFEFTGLQYNEPFETRYQYKLNGFDRDWRTADAKSRRAIYTNINKGTYEFMVKAGTHNNYWEETPVRLTVEVLPPFWRTGWFTGIVILFIWGVIYLFIELRTRIIRNQKEKLEQVVEVRTAEIFKQKINIELQQEEIGKQAAHIKQMNQLLKQHNIKLKKDLDNLSKARVLQKLLDYSEFKKIFPGEEDCIEYLVGLKWDNGYRCQRCGQKEYREEKNRSRRCRHCNYTESVTSGTIFHHLRFPIDKAFYILIITSTGRKINVSELSRKLDIRLKTAWSFHRKVKEELIGLKAPIRSDKGWASLIVSPKKINK
ncbi:MAG: two-component regulator propeller domain-containing protein [Bacteroidota bacterium]